MWIVALLIFVCVLFVYFKLYLPLQYWKNKGIPHLPPSLIIGNLGPVLFGRKNFNEFIREVCVKYEGYRYFGFYQFLKPSLVISDPELIKQVCIKNFENFMDHYEFLPKDVDTFWNKGLFALNGNQWHEMRSILSPAFTSKKMKAMFHLVAESSEKFVNHFVEKNEMVTVELMDIFTKFNNDIIASCTFGIECDSLKDSNNEFYLMGKEAFTFSGLKAFKFLGNSLSPTLSRIFRVKLFSNKVRDFFIRITKETIAYREKTELKRPDVMHLLIEARKGKLTFDEDNDVLESGFAGIEETYSIKRKPSSKSTITNEDIAAQALIFFFGTYDTVSTVLSHIMYDLVANMDAQEKLIEEVDYTLSQCNGKIAYENLFEMKYLDMVISESLRLWTAGMLNRKCVKPFLIEPKLPNEKLFLVEEGTEIMIPLYPSHRNPKYFKEPHKFDPERFNDKNKRNIKPFTYFPFGIGPRHCIGNRFGLMMIKLLIVNLLTHFQIVPVEKTVIPLVPLEGSLMLRSTHGYWFGLKPRTNK